MDCTPSGQRIALEHVKGGWHQEMGTSPIETGQFLPDRQVRRFRHGRRVIAGQGADTGATLRVGGERDGVLSRERLSWSDVGMMPR